MSILQGDLQPPKWATRGPAQALGSETVEPRPLDPQGTPLGAVFSLKGYLDQKVLVLPYLTGVSANLCTGGL